MSTVATESRGLVWVAAGLSFAVNAALIGLLWASLTARIDDHEQRLRGQESGVAIAQVQSQITALGGEMRERFARIETSLDVLMRRPPRGDER